MYTISGTKIKVGQQWVTSLSIKGETVRSIVCPSIGAKFPITMESGERFSSYGESESHCGDVILLHPADYIDNHKNTILYSTLTILGIYISLLLFLVLTL